MGRPIQRSVLAILMKQVAADVSARNPICRASAVMMCAKSWHTRGVLSSAPSMGESTRVLCGPY